MYDITLAYADSLQRVSFAPTATNVRFDYTHPPLMWNAPPSRTNQIAFVLQLVEDMQSVNVTLASGSGSFYLQMGFFAAGNYSVVLNTADLSLTPNVVAASPPHARLPDGWRAVYATAIDLAGSPLAYSSSFITTFGVR